MTCTWREISSKRLSGRSTPARAAIATRWMMQLVEPPTAMASATALSKDAALRISDGLRSSQTISTIRRPEIGRAAGRERVCQYLVISVVAVYIKKKKKKYDTK